MAKTFPYHVIASREDICNYVEVQKVLLDDLYAGKRVVLFGRRNTGKSSLVQSIIIPEFIRKNKRTFVLNVDFYGCRDLAHINERIRLAFEDGFTRSFPGKALMSRMVTLIRGLRPTINADPKTGELSLSVSSMSGRDEKAFDIILRQIGILQKEVSCLIVFDEFQDIALIEQAEGLMRASLQLLPSDLPVLVLGSKKHLLSRMFANPNAPFANWGIPLELPGITSEDYTAYINDRFEPADIQITLETTRYLQGLVQNNPECINMICHTILTAGTIGEMGTHTVDQAVKSTIRRFQSNFNEFLSTLTRGEYELLVAIANHQPVGQPRSKDFLKAVTLSSAAVAKVIRRLEDEALIYRTNEGFVVANPLLAIYLARGEVGGASTTVF